jgi:hypothetical protein
VPSEINRNENETRHQRSQVNLLEIPRAYPLPHAVLIQELHQCQQPSLWDLQFHSAALNGLDLGMGLFLLDCGGQGVDVVEDIDRFVDAQRRAHFAEHVVLGFA